MTLSLADILINLTGFAPSSAQNQPISGVVIDSHAVKPGSLFIALPGQKTDGHQYVTAAFAAGAVAALVDKPIAEPYLTVSAQSPHLAEDWQSPLCISVPNTLQALQQLAAHRRNQFSPQVIGITGSVGKTSTKELIALMLANKFNTLKNRGNLNNEIGLPLTLLELETQHQQVVLEMGMYNQGEIKSLCQIARPQLGVVTNVGPSHLERLGTIERIAAAKQELVESLPATGLAILNRDDPLVWEMRHHTSARIFSYGLSDQADLWADRIITEGLEGTRFVYHHHQESGHVKVPLLGRHSVHTALRAAAVGLSQGLAWEEIITGLQDPKAQLRLVAIPGPNKSILLDDTYNASPASTIAALNLLQDLTARRKIAVLGYMAELGAYEEEGHRKVGCRAADVADMLIVVGPCADLMANEAIACGLPPQMVHIMSNNTLVIAYLNAIATEGDTILVKGSRSMAMDTIVDALSTISKEIS